MKYRTINIDYLPEYEHQLAVLYVTGKWEPEVDHWDRDGLNNRFKNLRPCTSTQNKANMLGGHGKSGLKGAYTFRRKWRSQIQVQGKTIYLGVFETPEAAHAAYAEAAEMYFGEFARMS